MLSISQLIPVCQKARNVVGPNSYLSNGPARLLVALMIAGAMVACSGADDSSTSYDEDDSTDIVESGISAAKIGLTLVNPAPVQVSKTTAAVLPIVNSGANTLKLIALNSAAGFQVEASCLTKKLSPKDTCDLQLRVNPNRPPQAGIKTDKLTLTVATLQGRKWTRSKATLAFRYEFKSDACPRPRSSDSLCPAMLVTAKDPATGTCCEYPTPCSAPEGWVTFPNMNACLEPDSCLPPGEGNGVCVQVLRYAFSKQGTKCCQYATPCAVPAGKEGYSSLEECDAARTATGQ